MLKALWIHRGFVGSLVRRDFQVRSIRAIWGSAWLVIQPAIQILIYTVIFAEVLRAKLPGVDDRLAYGLFLCAGVITWNYFSELVLRGQTLFLEQAHLLKAVQFPRSTLPLALLSTATLNVAIITSLFLATLLLLDRWPGWVLLAALPLLVIQGLLGISLGVVTGTLNVFFRDVGQAMGILLQFWFWLTPIVYPVTIVPEGMRSVLAWNPIFPLVRGYQRIVVEHTPPDWGMVAPVAALSVGIALVSWVVFRALGPDLVDEL
jgi:lipopolysaccharide transport system permease protein